MDNQQKVIGKIANLEMTRWQSDETYLFPH